MSFDSLVDPESSLGGLSAISNGIYFTFMLNFTSVLVISRAESIGEGGISSAPLSGLPMSLMASTCISDEVITSPSSLFISRVAFPMFASVFHELQVYIPFCPNLSQMSARAPGSPKRVVPTSQLATLLPFVFCCMSYYQ